MSRANDSKLTSWVDVPQGSDFPIQNLPFGVFKTHSAPTPRAGIAIGNMILDLAAAFNGGLFSNMGLPADNVFMRPVLNDFIALGKPIWRATRERISDLLRTDNPELRDNAKLREKCLFHMREATMLMPVHVPNYVDFYSSEEHATNVGKMFRDPTNPLLPNWKHIPIGYNGRASSIRESGVNFHRPVGQLKADTDPAPVFAASRQLDFELEVAFITGRENALGQPITTDKTDDYVFGLVLFNDWSARDIQRWEYVPLGPFLGKSFFTSVSPWIVTLDALEPFRTEGPRQDPPVLPYLRTSGASNFDLELEVHLQPSGSKEELRICKTNFKHMYWSMSQQLAHLTSNGTNVCVGDMYASGTVSGPTPDSYGSMLELCWKGTKPLELPNGEKRNFVQDGDTVIMRGFGLKNGVRIGFGEVRNTVLPAR